MIDTAEAVRLPLPDFDCNLLAGARGLPRLLTAERNPGVDAINIFPVFAGHFACFLRRRLPRFCWSAGFLRRVRFPAAPLKGPGQGKVPEPGPFSINAPINNLGSTMPAWSRCKT
jgi:hypothetical protein